MCGRQLPAVQQAPAQPQYQQPYQQPMYPAGPAPVQPQYQQQPYQQPQYQQPPQQVQYQQQPYQQAQYQQPAAQQGMQPMMQQPGKPKKNMMLIAILAIVAVVIVIVAIVLLMGLGGSSSLSIVGSPDKSNVNLFYWGTHNDNVSVDVTVKNNGAATASGTIHVKIDSTIPYLGTKYTSEGTKSISLAAGAQQTFSVDVPMGLEQATIIVLSAVVTATL
jgi:flagellar basal body-associated protein FliL